MFWLFWWVFWLFWLVFWLFWLVVLFWLFCCFGGFERFFFVFLVRKVVFFQGSSTSLDLQGDLMRTYLK